MSTGTTKRGIRISDPDWAEFQAACKEAGMTASEVVRGLLRGWVLGERINPTALRDNDNEGEK